VEDVLGAIAKRNPSDDGERRTQQQNQRSSKASR
jgi:hypothetical protein